MSNENDKESSGDEQPGSGNDKDKTVAKTAGFVVFSGIAMSILKALNPYNKPDLKMNCSSTAKPQESTQSEMQAVVQQCQPEPIIKELKPSNCVEPDVKESSAKVIDIVRGDTLWGLSRKHGVSIEAIKQANGLEGDTIYSGKKLIIP